MEAALAEMALEETKEIEDDKDFVVGKDEEDIFESDFESTDEEAPQAEDAGEQMVQEEEKREKRATRSRVEKVTAAAHERNKATFNPQAATSKPPPKLKVRIKRRVSLGIAVDAETGEALSEDKQAAGTKRQSKRRHTVLNTSATATRLKESKEKKAIAPKKKQVEARIFTQDELIARALDNEEGNIIEHRDYLQLEEEKRKRARVVRTAIAGPLLRWVSKAEEVKVSVVVDRPQNTNPYMAAYTTMASGQTPYAQYPYGYMTTTPYGQSSQPGSSANAQAAWIPYMQPAVQTQQTIERMEKFTKNYVIHELGQQDGVSKPKWNQSMAAMFGDDVDWSSLKVYSGKSRPLARIKHKCPITGKPARYLDPRTGVPFADAHAYQTLTRILNHEYVWNPALGCYVSHQPPSGSNDAAMDVS
ncbi:hypothetical protein HGRIS_007306 [Hohenbuehelia grisea]